MRHDEDTVHQHEQMAFQSLLTRYRGLLYRVCLRYSGREATVEDLMQDISIALWQRREWLQEVPSGVRQAAWIWRVARNAAIDSVRRMPGHQALEEWHTDDMEVEDRSLVSELYEQIEQLGEEERRLVRMQLEGYSYEEMAAAMGLSVKNVSVRLVRIREKLRSRMTGAKDL